MKKSLLSLIAALATLTSSGQSPTKYINPTGTYTLDGKTREKNGEIYGYTGSIQVKSLSQNKIAMTFYICKGAPSYNSGDFVDTLLLENNTAVYKDTATNCITTFVFTAKGVSVSEGPEANLGSCWGHGVVASGHFTKKSSKVPVLEDPMTGEKL